MRTLWRFSAGVAILGLTGCAGLQFNETENVKGALRYREAEPYLLVTVTGDCVAAASVITLPGARRSVSLHNGYGSAALTVNLSTANTITGVGQTTDTQIPATLTAVGALASAGAAIRGVGAPSPPKATPCPASATLYGFEVDAEGKVEVDTTAPIVLIPGSKPQK
jgi:hypothetical protein